jgi:hypothetical protein
MQQQRSTVSHTTQTRLLTTHHWVFADDVTLIIARTVPSNIKQIACQPSHPIQYTHVHWLLAS